MMEVENSNLVTVSCADHSQYISIALRNLFDSKRGTDFELHLDNKSVRAHRLILELFLAPELIGIGKDFLSISPAVKQEVVDDGYGSGRNILDIVMEFLYKGEVAVPEQQLEELLEVARVLDFKMLLTAVQVCRPVDIIAEEEQNFHITSNFSESVNEVLGARIEDVKYDIDTFDDRGSMQLDANQELTLRPCSVNRGSQLPVACPSMQGDDDDDTNSFRPFRHDTESENICDIFSNSEGQGLQLQQKYIKLEPENGYENSQSILEDGPLSLDQALSNGDGEAVDYGGATSDDPLYPGTSSNPCKNNSNKPEATKMFKCPNCVFKTSDCNSYRHHCLLIHQQTVPGHPATLHKCPKCEFTSLFSNSINLHLSKMHSQEQDCSCPHCRYVGKLNHHLKRHLLLVHGVGGTLFPCKLCRKRFASRGALEVHCRVHANALPFKCPHCDFTSKKMFNLKVHKNVVHGEGEPRFTCEMCNKRCESRLKLEHHITTHANTKGQPIECLQCNFATNKLSSMKRHMTVIHGEGDSIFTCEVCKKCYASRHALDRHITTHTAKGRFKCPHCNYAADTIYFLKKHLSVTHGEGDSYFTCYVCKIRCHSQANLKIHLQIHSNDRPFKCTLCSYAAKQSNALNAHMSVIHGKGDSRFTCKTCRRRCTCLAALERHLKIHTNK